MITAILFNLLNMLGLYGAGIIVAVLKLLGIKKKPPGQGFFLCPVFCFIKNAALGLTESHKK